MRDRSAGRPMSAPCPRALEPRRRLDVLSRRRALPRRRSPLRPYDLATAARPALRASGSERGRAFGDLVVGRHLDPIALRGREDLSPRARLRALGLELGLVEARHRVAHVRLVLDGQVSLATTVDVRELALGYVLPLSDGP